MRTFASQLQIVYESLVDEGGEMQLCRRSTSFFRSHVSIAIPKGSGSYITPLKGKETAILGLRQTLRFACCASSSLAPRCCLAAARMPDGTGRLHSERTK